MQMLLPQGPKADVSGAEDSCLASPHHRIPFLGESFNFHFKDSRLIVVGGEDVAKPDEMSCDG